ncbi:MAG: thiamine-phosphate kinase [Xanthomonadales bacterium]|jgi:thiamine-monophosphate kinase|nr:thiamine-phosphate kinase [Xanthomonadales bacterium]
MPEFDLIRRLQEIIELPAAPGSRGCVLGIGDDAAVLDIPSGRQLVVCTDTLVEGVHFPANTCPHAIGYKSLAVNLSDLAAMGAEPGWFFMALTLPDGDAAWVESFARGMAGLAQEAGIVLAGGDTTSGGLSITVTAVGLVDKGMALTRGGAKPGDHILVSGTPGRAALALQQLQAGAKPLPDCLAALEYPVPRLALGLALGGTASACIDISDGLAADLGHILERSDTGARLDLGRLPGTDSFSGLGEQERWSLQLAGGDDYELCFTVPPGAMHRIPAIASECGVALTEIGIVAAHAGLVLEQPGGGLFEPGNAGYQHFSATDSKKE